MKDLKNTQAIEDLIVMRKFKETHKAKESLVQKALPTTMTI